MGGEHVQAAVRALRRSPSLLAWFPHSTAIRRRHPAAHPPALTPGCRYLLRGWVESTLRKKWAKWAIIDKAIEHDGWKLVLIMRFSPIIPYNLVRGRGGSLP